MPDNEELQARIEGLRILVSSLLAHSPVQAIRADVRKRFEVLQDMGLRTPVTDRYLELIHQEMDHADAHLAELQAQQARLANTDTAPSPDESAPDAART